MINQLPALNFQGQPEPQDTVDFSELIRILKQRAHIILLLTALGAFAALLHVLFAAPQFTASGALYLGNTQQDPGNGDNGPNGTVNFAAYSQQSDVETQIELLTTGTLIERAVLSAGLNAVIQPVGTPPLIYWRWQLFKGGSTTAFLPTPETLQVVDATLVGHFRLVTGPNNTYALFRSGDLDDSRDLVLTGTIGQAAQKGGSRLVVQFAALDPFNTVVGSQSAAAQTRTIEAGKIFDVKIFPPEILANKIINGALHVNAGGSPTQPTKLADIEFQWSNPYQATLFVDNLMQGYVATQLQWKAEAASVTESFVVSQLAQVKEKLAAANQELSNFQAKTGIVDPQQSAAVEIEQMSKLQQQRATELLKLESLQHLQREMKSINGTVNAYLISQTDDTVLSALTTSLSEAQVKLSQLRAEFTDNAQDVQIEKAQVKQLRSSITDLIDNDLTSAKDNLSSIDALIASDRTQAQSQPSDSIKVEALKRTATQLDKLFEVLTEKGEQAQISKASTISDTRIVTPPQLPLRATSPKFVITIVAGALAGLVAGFVLVFARRTFSGRYESEEQIRRSIQLPIFGAVPRQTQALIGNDIIENDGFNPFTEAFQLIKRNIYRNTDIKPAIEGHATAILVISASKQDGKTTIAANLANSLADDGKRVVLVDCDFYLSRLRGSSNFAGQLGLTDWLSNGQKPELHRWPNSKFWLLTVGTGSKKFGGRLSEGALREIIETLSTEFEYVILDSPPFPVVSDGLILGSVSDLILSVVNVSHTMRKTFEIHNELIETLDKPHGLIINGADAMTYDGTDSYFFDSVKDRRKFTGWFQI